MTQNPRITLAAYPIRRVIGTVREESLTSSAMRQLAKVGKNLSDYIPIWTEQSKPINDEVGLRVPTMVARPILDHPPGL
jgi:hypothetical protein